MPARAGVVGHTEWVEFAVVGHVPAPGEIVSARETFSAVGGGGAVAAVQMARLGGGATFLTALGRDANGEASLRQLREHGVDTHVAWREGAQRRAFTHLDDAAERTITVLGERISPSAGDDLPWAGLADLDAIYFTAGDAGALQAARAARVLTATPRARATIEEAGVELDVLVASADDAGEREAAEALRPHTRRVVLTRGAQGGGWLGVEGDTGTWEAAALPGPPVDAYGCGDSFAAGLTYGLGAEMTMTDAVALAARCGATCLAGRGPYGRRLDPA